MEPNSYNEEDGECLFEDWYNNEEARSQFGSHQRYVSYQEIQRIINEIYLIHLKNSKGEKRTCTVVDDIM